MAPAALRRAAAVALVLLVVFGTVAPAALAGPNDSASTNAGIRNKGPRSGAGSAPEGVVVPNAGGTVSVPVAVRAGDDNGHADLRVDVVVTLPEGAGEHRAPVALTGRPVGGSATEAEFPHEIVMHHYDPPGTYTVTFKIRDRANENAPDVSVTFVYGEILALHLVERSLDFGTLDPGTTTPDSAPTTIYNYGNVAIDVEATAKDLEGADDSIPGDRLLWSAAGGSFVSLDPSGTMIRTKIAPGPAESAILDWKLATPNVLPGDYAGVLTLAAASAE